MPLSFSFRLFLFSVYEELDKQKLTHQKSKQLVMEQILISIVAIVQLEANLTQDRSYENVYC